MLAFLFISCSHLLPSQPVNSAVCDFTFSFANTLTSYIPLSFCPMAWQNPNSGRIYLAAFSMPKVWLLSTAGANKRVSRSGTQPSVSLRAFYFPGGLSPALLKGHSHPLRPPNLFPCCFLPHLQQFSTRPHCISKRKFLCRNADFLSPNSRHTDFPWTSFFES